MLCTIHGPLLQLLTITDVDEIFTDSKREGDLMGISVLRHCRIIEESEKVFFFPQV